MGILSALKHIVQIESLFQDELKRKHARDQILQTGITEEWVKELMRQADTGVIAELSFPSGVSLRITRTLNGMTSETKNAGASSGVVFKEQF